MAKRDFLSITGFYHKDDIRLTTFELISSRQLESRACAPIFSLSEALGLRSAEENQGHVDDHHQGWH